MEHVRVLQQRWQNRCHFDTIVKRERERELVNHGIPPDTYGTPQMRSVLETRSIFNVSLQ